VWTESGSTYLLDREAGTACRVRGEGSGELRRDGEPVPLLRCPTPIVGQPMVMVLRLREDSQITVRVTSPVQRIDPYASGPADSGAVSTS
jgi:hypothetical protein